MSSNDGAREQLALAILFSSAFCVLALFAATAVAANVGLDTGIISAYSVTFLLFFAQDRAVAVLFIAVLSLSIVFFNFRTDDRRMPVSRAPVWARLPIALLCAAAFLLAWAAGVWVHHSFDMSLDEFETAFQARTFLNGKLLGEIPPLQFEDSYQLQPLYFSHDAQHHLWAPATRPVFAAFRALFGLFGADRLVNPAFAALSIWAIADIAKRAFPDVPEAPSLSALLLLLSPQFLLTAASGFAFSAHLALNLLWLSLFLRGSFRDHCLAGAVGFLATGLHQITFHPLFAAPFLAALVLGRFGPRTALIPYIIAYSLALPLWSAWDEVSVWLQTGDTSVLPRRLGDLAYFRGYGTYIKATADGIADIAGALTLTNIFRYFLWLSPAVLPLSMIAFVRHRTIGLVPTLCGVSVVLGIVASYLLLPNQMHTWGSRYYHPVLGCMVIFAVAGYCALRQQMELRSLQAGVGFLLIVSAAVLLPWRAMQVEEKVGPRAQVQKAIEALDADYVVLGDGLWFGNDYIRNDPFLRNRPLIANSAMLKRSALAGKKVIVLNQRDLNRMGLPRATLLEPGQ